MNRYLKYTILILPVLFFFIGINFNRAKFVNDPDYIYLINAVAICDGKSVGHIDNPGTTVMQIGAATIALTHLFYNPQNETLVTHVLNNPDTFIEAIQTFILVLNTLILLLLGLVAFKKTDSILIAILLQSATFITTNTLDHIWTKVSPEPLLFFITCLYVIAILYFYANRNKTKYKYIIIFALLMGAGLGTKATFLPLFFFPFIVLPSFKNKILYVAGVIASFVLFTIPAIPEYKSMFYWFRNLLSHSGKYGHGNKGLIDMDTYIPNIFKIFENNLLFGIVTLSGVILLVVILIQTLKKKIKFNPDIRILTGLVVTNVFGILLVAKHYHANHYLIPVLLLTGITLFFILKEVRKFIKPSVLKKSIFPFVIVSLILFLGWKQAPIMKKVNYGYKISNEEMDSTNVMLKRDYPDYTVINYYTFSLNKFNALKFGDVYTKQKMLPSLKKTHPNTYFYDFHSNRILNWDTEISLNNIIKSNGKKILMINGPRDKKKAEEMGNRGFPLNLIYSGRLQTIYELDTIAYNKLNITHSIPILQK